MAGHSQFKNTCSGRTSRTPRSPSCSPSFRAKSRYRPSLACPTRTTPAAPLRHHGGQGAEHVEGRDRAPHQEKPGREAENYEEVRYEGYGPGGVAVIVEALTDNRNRTAATSVPRFRNMAARWARTAPSPSCSTGSDRSSIRAMRRYRFHAGSGHRGRCRRIRFGQRWPRISLPARGFCRRARCAGGQARPAAIGQNRLAADQHCAVNDSAGETLSKLLGRARRPRRRAERLRQLRNERRAHGKAVRG